MKTLLISIATAATLIVVSGLATTAAADEPSRLYLQQVGARTAIVKWRGAEDQVCWARKISHLNKRNWPHCAAASVTEGDHHEAMLTQLAPDKQYFYSVGEPGPGSGNIEQTFRTAPQGNKSPKDGNVHIWLIGDSGTETELSPFSGQQSHPGEAEEVKQGFLAYNADKEPVDLFVLLGDNAYLEGTDAQWQGAFFDIYPNIMNKAAVWPTIGNHEMGGGCFDLSPFIGAPPGSFFFFLGGVSDSSDPMSFHPGPAACDGLTATPGPPGINPPYLDIFSLPSGGELGGVPSGTEQYYSMNYGNVHLVSLDAQLTNADPVQREAMRQWLISDLSNNTRDWTVVIFHHPPYSKGENHNSDFEQREIDMREQFTPVFDEYGVDVVYGGHAHSYERSYYIGGHTGFSETFDPAEHAELNANGEPALGQGAEEYEQISLGTGQDDKVVYTVAGSSGKADEEDPCEVDPMTGEEPQIGCTRTDWLQHPVHIEQGGRRGVPVKGSVVLDATATSLRSRFVDVNGDVIDEFTINR